MADAQRPIEIERTFHRFWSVQKDFRDPRNQDKNEDEHVVAFQPSPNRLQLADLETWQDQIFTHQFFPFTLQQVAVFHHHRDEKMRFEHADAGAERVVKTVAARFDPEQYPEDREIKEKDDVRNFTARKRDRHDRGAAGDRPIRRDIEPLPPNHDPPHLAAVEMRHRVDVAWVVEAALDRNRGLLVGSGGYAVFSCHSQSINRITEAESNIYSFHGYRAR